MVERSLPEPQVRRLGPAHIFWTITRFLDRVGVPRVAAALGNAVCRDRRFSVSRDGERITRQSAAIIASPDLMPSRYAYLAERVEENWLFAYRPSKQDLIVDVGAGIGDEAIIFSRMARRVIAIEAHPGTFAYLQRNIALNQLPNVTPVCVGLGGRDGKMRISDEFAHYANRAVESGGVEVPTRTLASLCRELDIETIDFLKMNIEGAEREAVRGFGDVRIRHMVISCHDFVGRPEMATFDAVRASLIEQGYRITTRPDHSMSYTRCNIYAAHPDA